MSFMVSLYPDGRNAKEREMGVRFQHVPFPCGKFLPFHTVCPEYEQTGTESVEKLSVQNPDQPFQFFPRVKGECLIPIDKGISRFNIRLTLDKVSRPFFCGVLSVQRIGFRVFPCPDECVEEDGTVPVPSGMPPYPELFAAYAIGNQQFRIGCNPRASFRIVTGTLFIFMAKRCLWEKADMNFPVIAPFNVCLRIIVTATGDISDNVSCSR